MNKRQEKKFVKKNYCKSYGPNNKGQKKNFKTKLGRRTYQYCKEYMLVKKLKKSLREFLSTYDTNKLVNYTVFRCRTVPDASIETVVPTMLEALESYKVYRVFGDCETFHTLLWWLSSDFLGKENDPPKVKNIEQYLFQNVGPINSNEKRPYIRASDLCTEKEAD